MILCVNVPIFFFLLQFVPADVNVMTNSCAYRGGALGIPSAGITGAYYFSFRFTKISTNQKMIIKKLSVENCL